MRRAIGWFVGGLPFDARSRRAIDETLLDWDGEATEAKTAWERTVTEVRGAASIARVASLSVLRESVDFSWLRGLGRRFAVATGVAVLMTFSTYPYYEEFGSGAIVLSLALVPSMVATILVPALLLTIAWRPVHQRAPAFGAAVLVALMAWPFFAEAVPWSVEQFRQLAFRLLTDDPFGSTRPLAPSPPRGSAWVMGWIFLAGTTVTFASALARRNALRNWAWLLIVPLLFNFSYSAVKPFSSFTAAKEGLLARPSRCSVSRSCCCLLP
jgi:hypothetical protein